jgi:WD40 repeat protein
MNKVQMTLHRLCRLLLGGLIVVLCMPNATTLSKAGLSAKEILRIGQGAITLSGMRPDGKAFVTGVGNKLTLYDAHLLPIQVLSGHSAPITTYAWSPDSTRLLTAAEDGSAILRDASTGMPRSSLIGHTGRIQDVGFSQDNRWAITGSNDKTVIIWDAQSGARLQTLTGARGAVLDVSLSSDGARAYTIDSTDSVRIWDAQSGALLLTLQKPAGSFSVVGYSHDMKYAILSENERAGLALYNVLTGHVLGRLESQSKDGRQALTHAYFDPKDKKLAVVRQFAPGVDLYTLPDLKRITVLDGHSDELSSFGFSRDGKYFLTASRDKTARLYDAETGALLATLSGHSELVQFHTWSKDGRYLLTADAARNLFIWDGKTGQALGKIQAYASGTISTAYFDDDASHLFSLSRAQGRLDVWNVNDHQLAASLSGFSSPYRAIRWSADGKRVAVGGLDGVIHVWNAATGQDEQLLTGHSQVVYDLSWGEDGRELASASGDFTAKLWDIQSGKVKVNYDVFTDRVYSVALNQRRKLLVIAAREAAKPITIWSTTKSQRLDKGTSGGTNTIARWNTDFTKIATGMSGGFVGMLDLPSSRRLTHKAHRDMVVSLVWSVDGTLVATGGNDKAIVIYDGQTLKPMRTMQTDRAVTALAWSPDQRLLATPEDNNIALWDAMTGQRLGTIFGHDASVYSLDWAADSRLASTGADGTVRIWQIVQGD